MACGEASTDNLDTPTLTDAAPQAPPTPLPIVEYAPTEEPSISDFDGITITGVFRRYIGAGAGAARYYFHDDNTVELWNFGNRTFYGTYSISENTVTLYGLDGSIERSLTLSPDGQRLFGTLSSYEKSSDTVPVFEEPSLVGRWELTSTRGTFVPEELEFFADGRKSSTLFLDDGELDIVWFYWYSEDGVLTYWRYDECESGAYRLLYTIFNSDSELAIRNVSGLIRDYFQRIG